MSTGVLEYELRDEIPFLYTLCYCRGDGHSLAFKEFPCWTKTLIGSLRQVLDLLARSVYTGYLLSRSRY